MVIAVSQEDTNLRDAAKFLTNFEAGPGFEIVHDLNREKSEAYDRTTTYLIDKQGVVRQVFPSLIQRRPSWDAVLVEAERILEVGAADGG